MTRDCDVILIAVTFQVTLNLVLKSVCKPRGKNFAFKLAILTPMMLNNLRKLEGDRPVSVPPSLPASKFDPLNNRPSSIPPGALGHHRISSDVLTPQKGLTGGTSLDLMAHLQQSGPSVVKTRSGSVLSRGFILKTDHYPSGIQFVVVISFLTIHRSCS